ncbi:MAG: GNAT family N-acetyltransferase [Elusimicrobiales bacterium]|nr:GNAT family N-acetyltransferase [Elusimicrobiales bacterium]MCK5583912.1 GNAT family N-acetyltransferase [Elusimicrobiales bacterium]
MQTFISEISEKNLIDFVNVPYKLFKRHPHWVGELKKDVLHLLDLKHPFWQHAERKLFIAEKDGQSIGRIAAILNHDYNKFHNENIGFFGFFDCADDEETAKKLFKQASLWLKEKGATNIRGPVNPSTNETCGILIEGFDSPPVIMMPYNPSYYLNLLEKAGFSKIKDLLAFKRYSQEPFTDRFKKILKRIHKSASIKIKKADTKNLSKELAVFQEIYNEAWDENWGFTPIKDDEITDLANALKPLLKPEYLYFVQIDNRPIGFVLLLPDFNIPLKTLHGRFTPLNILPFLWKMFKIRQGRFLAMGVKKEYRNRGIELLLIEQAMISAREFNWNYVELSWTLEDNEKVNKVIDLAGGKTYKKYRIYDKTL